MKFPTTVMSKKVHKFHHKILREGGVREGRRRVGLGSKVTKIA